MTQYEFKLVQIGDIFHTTSGRSSYLVTGRRFDGALEVTIVSARGTGQNIVATSEMAPHLILDIGCRNKTKMKSALGVD